MRRLPLILMILIKKYILKAKRPPSSYYMVLTFIAILAPITRLSDVIEQPSVALIYRQSPLPTLAARALSAAATENQHMTRLTRLLSVLLGDDTILFPPTYPPPSPSPPPDDGESEDDDDDGNSRNPPIPTSKSLNHPPIVDQPNPRLRHCHYKWKHLKSHHRYNHRH